MPRGRRLSPETWTFKELRRHLMTIEGQAPKYVYTQLNCLRYMEREWNVRLHGDPDDIHGDFLDYVMVRREQEEDPEDALNNCQKAMKNLFKAFGIKHKYPWVKIRRKKRHVKVYDDETAYRLINHTYSDDPAVNATFQHLAHAGHYMGPRVPSELFTLRVSDVTFKERKVTFRQWKTKSMRTIIVEPFVITSPVDKSLWNYYKNWRPKLLERGSYEGDAFWLNGDGEPLSMDHYRQELSAKGKEICPYFHPYLMRHWCATYRLIQSYLKTGVFDIVGINMFMDHASLDQTYQYVHIAERFLRQHQEKSQVGRLTGGST